MIIATSQERAGKVSDRCYYYSKIVSALPEPVEGRLVAKDLERGQCFIFLETVRFFFYYKHKTDDN